MTRKIPNINTHLFKTPGLPWEESDSDSTPTLTLFNINDTDKNRIYFTSTAGITFTARDFTTSTSKTVSSVTEVGGGSYYLTMSLI